MRYSRDILESLADSDAPDVVRLGAVALAAEIVDAHVQDPTIRKAWSILRDVVIESWIEKVGSKEAEREEVDLCKESSSVNTETESASAKLREAISSRMSRIDAMTTASDPCGDNKSISLSEFDDVIKIGRLPTSNVRFDDDSVARIHAVIEKVSRRLLSLNGELSTSDPRREQR